MALQSPSYIKVEAILSYIAEREVALPTKYEDSMSASPGFLN